MVNFTSLLFVVLLSSSYYVGPAIASIECDFCKQLITYVYNLFDGEETINSIENVLNSVCDQLFTGNQSVTCENYVQQFTPMVVDLIVKTTNPDEACKLIQLCGGSDESKSLLEIIKFKVESIGDQCDSCLVDIESIRSDLRLARKDHISKLVQSCGQFPTSDESLCDSYISSINQIYDSLDLNLVPREVCHTFDVCPVSSLASSRSIIGKIEPDCLLCRQVFKLVDQVIEKQAKINIETALDKVCDSVLPSSSRRSCRNYVDRYTTQLINFIHRHDDPYQACLIMGMCNEQDNWEDNLIPRSTKLNLIATQTSSPSDCDNCHKSLGWAGVTIKGYVTTLSSMLTNTCLVYTHNQDQCKSYMSGHFDSDLNQLISTTSSNYFCTNIFGQCPTERNGNN